MMVFLHICNSISDASLLSLSLSSHAAVCSAIRAMVKPKAARQGVPSGTGHQHFDPEPTSLMDTPLGMTVALFRAGNSRMEQRCTGTAHHY